MTYQDFKDLCDKVLNIVKIPKYDGYQRGFASMVYNVFDKRISGGVVKNENISNQELVEKLHNQLFENLRSQIYTHLLWIIC